MDTTPIVAVVDDDEAVRIATSSLIRSLGWNVRAFGSAEEFLQSEDIDSTACLISDVLMPGMSGVALHEQLRRLGYAVPTMFTTAFPTPDLQTEVLANGALALLEKPVVAKSIAYWVDVALGKSKPR